MGLKGKHPQIPQKQRERKILFGCLESVTGKLIPK
jgi:hypothetical protein